MPVNQSVLREIVTQAQFLSEILSNPQLNTDNLQDEQQQIADERLKRWCQLAAQAGSRQKFERRLHWEGLNIETARSLLAKVPIVDSQTPPGWAETLALIIEIAAKTEENSLQELITNSPFPNPLDPENPIPFEDLLLPLQLTARYKLKKYLQNTSPLDLLTETAYKTLERSLLQKLLNLSAKTLEFEFSRFRPLGHSLFSLLVGETKGEKSKVHYNNFIQKMLQDGLLSFFQQYPVLGRLIATTIDLWVEATAEFLQRLQTDLPEIQQVFTSSAKQQELGKVNEIKPNLSDAHNGGRSVIIITFDSGLKLVYKPKDLGVDVAYSQFLDWCNQQIQTDSEKTNILPFKVLQVINRSNYGWVEYIEQEPCTDIAAAQRFYQRGGMLLCLLYLLETTDCHFENLIACGEHLVAIDLESLMHHDTKRMEELPEVKAAEKSAVNQKFWDSVLRIGMLPNWQFNRDSSIAFDISGLGSVDPQQAPRRVAQWKSINTDDMHVAFAEVTIPLQKNIPTLNGVPLSPNDYLEELISGFQRMYRFLIEKREILVGNDSPLAAFQGQKVRFLFRATQIYSVTLQQSYIPKMLRSGIDWSMQLEIACQAFTINKEKPHAWPIFHAELKALERLDIPFLGALSDSVDLSIGLESPIADFFKAPSYNKVISKLQKLDDADLALQVAIIRDAFYARVARSMSTAINPVLEAEDLSQVEPLTTAQLLDSAIKIANQIEERALIGADGRVNWIGLSYIFSADRFQLQILAESLYDGNCGIALFLAALAKISGNAHFHELSLGALKPLREFLQLSGEENTKRFIDAHGIGGATGLSSLIYSLVKISQFLEETDILEDAQQIASLITPELISADEKLDIISGSAGAILGLLALYEATSDRTILDKANLCAQHLLHHQIDFGNGIKTWKTVTDLPFTGFSHGAAGIAYALLRLYKVTQNKSYLDAAIDGIAYERSVFSPQASNWPDFRPFRQQNGQTSFDAISWCNGAPGIGLARLGGLSILDTEEIRQDIQAALQTTAEYTWQSISHLCCGHFGRLEVLLTGAQKLCSPQLQELTLKKAAWLVKKAEQAGGYQLLPNLPPQVFAPSFFGGTSGIGYQLLRFAYPSVLPSVLLWD